MSHKYLILGLLAQNPMTGYDIRKHVKDVLSAVTNASYGTLYPTLHKLLEDGDVQVDEVEQGSRPSKKVYSITSRGQSALESWLKEPPADDKIRREFLLKFYFASNFAEQELHALLTRRRDEMRSKLESLRAERSETSNPRQQWIIDYAITIYRAEIDWLQQVEKEIIVA
jgi:DNA-binding PadR family transcriptional regulator